MHAHVTGRFMGFVHIANGQQEQTHLGRQVLVNVVLDIQLLKSHFALVARRHYRIFNF